MKYNFKEPHIDKIFPDQNIRREKNLRLKSLQKQFKKMALSRLKLFSKETAISQLMK